MFLEPNFHAAGAVVLKKQPCSTRKEIISIRKQKKGFK